MGIFFDMLHGKEVSRAPVMAKIWLDLAARLLERRDWPTLFRDPALSASTVVEAAILAENDCSRLFLFAPRDIRPAENGYLHWRDGRPLGGVDADGGAATLLSSNDDFDMTDPATVIHYNAYKCPAPLMNTVEDVERLRIPTLEEYEALFGKAVETCRELAEGRLDLAGDCGSGTMAFCISMNGMAKALMDIYDEPELLHAMMRKGAELCLQTARFLISKGIRILRYNDSAANMMVISPDTWREFIKPNLAHFCREVHGICPEARVYCHICGDVRPILVDLIETGVDCIAPLDPMGGCSIEEIRALVGDSVMLMGGVNTMSFLNRTPQELAEETARCVRAGLRNGGRYAVGSGCAVPGGASLESLLAISRAAAGISREML